MTNASHLHHNCILPITHPASMTLKAILVLIITSINPIVIADIDLTDPAVEAAATKIQSAFKGFKIRKNITKQ